MRTIFLVAIILIVVFIAPVYADSLVPDTIRFYNTISNDGWLVANGKDSCLAVVQVNNGTDPIQGLEVNFSVRDPNFGTFYPLLSTTNESGIAISSFTVGHKSGNATLIANVSYPFMGETKYVEWQGFQNIDHDTPYNLSFYDVVSETRVGSTVPIIMKYQDRWGNPIDAKRDAETVTYMVSSPARDALFLNYYSITAIVPVNAAGEAIANLQVSKQTAINTVRVNPDMGTIPDKYFFIQGVANGTPWKIIQEFDPEPPKLSINGDSFTITYTFSDEFGNGIMNTPVNITTSLGEDFSRNTNSVGQVILSYGPKDSIGPITFTASATGNTTLPPVSREIEFVAQEIQNMQLTAVPSIMPSLDVNGNMKSVLKAKLIDKFGNPVVGETVTFTKGDPEYGDTPYGAIVAEPILGATSAKTNSFGFAEVYFTPGEFNKDLESNVYVYDETASGRCNVTASWNNMAQTLQLSWKNYPYLSIDTEVNPQAVNVGDTFDAPRPTPTVTNYIHLK